MNKIHYNILFLIAFTLFSCTKDKGEININKLVDYQGETHLKVTVNNCSDTTVIYMFSRTLIPLGQENKQLIVRNDSTFNVTLKSTHPYQGYLIYQNKRIPIYTIPNDTLEIYVDFNMSNTIPIKYEGNQKQINDYFLEKYRHFKYFDIAIPATNYTSSSYSIYEGAEKIDSLFSEEQKFFSNYLKNYKLPDWFIEIEKLNLKYYNASFKIGAISSRNHFNKENTKANDSYFNFLDSIQVNNPKACLSSNYYEFLTSYFHSQIWDKNENNKSGFERAYPILEQILPIAINELSGETRGNYLAYIFSRYFLLYAEDSNDVLKVDSLFDSFSNYINDETLINAVKANENSKIEKFEEKSFLRKGEEAPDFYLSDINGKFYSLQDFKGKIIYLNFWATWCSPCIKTIPDKNSLIKEYSNAPIAFINISFDKEIDKWEKYIRDSDILGLNLICKGNWEDILKTKYYIQGIPKYVLIDENGKVIESNATSPSNKSELARLINKYLK